MSDAKKPSLFQVLLTAAILWSVAAKQPAFLYPDERKRIEFVPIERRYSDSFRECDYYDCGRRAASERAFYRYLTERGQRQRYERASARLDDTRPADCTPELEWLAGLAELSHMNEYIPDTRVRPCLPPYRQPDNRPR